MFNKSKTITVISTLILTVAVATITVLATMLINILEAGASTIVFVSESVTAKYSGEYISSDEWVMESGELKEGHRAVVQTSGQQKMVGTAQNNLTVKIVDADGNDVSDEYNIVTKPGTLTVNPMPISVESGTASFEYTGEEYKLDEHIIHIPESTQVYKDLSKLLKNHYLNIKITGKVKDVTGPEGVPNTVDSISIIYEEGDIKADVTNNFEITVIEGKLIVSDVGGWQGKLNSDLDGDGLADTNIDLDMDGQPDLNVNVNKDPAADINLDTDRDGEPDLNIDTQGKWRPNLNVDTDGDGLADMNIDVDGDEMPDLNIDIDGDKIPDLNIDVNRDGEADLNITAGAQLKPYFNIDKDGDGVADLNIDKDGDGEIDLNYDEDGDGVADLNIDSDRDGRADVNIDIYGSDDKADLNIDTNGDGIADINIDTNGDGYADTNIDTNGDKRPDTSVDKNGDGKATQNESNVNIDTNGDGVNDLNKDTNADGYADINIDTNGDKIPDLNIDTNGDGIPDTNIDVDRDGKADINLDSNSDGIPDANIDTNGDMIAEIDIIGDGSDKSLNLDTDKDGIPDTNIDVNDDGKPDLNLDPTRQGSPELNVDKNGNGKADLNVDTDGDGEADLNIDTDGDGRADLNVDTNGDGKPELNVDIDNDGYPDLNIDVNGDGRAETNIDVNNNEQLDKEDNNLDYDSETGLVGGAGDGKPDGNVDTSGDGVKDFSGQLPEDEKPEDEKKPENTGGVGSIPKYGTDEDIGGEGEASNPDEIYYNVYVESDKDARLYLKGNTVAIYTGTGWKRGPVEYQKYIEREGEKFSAAYLASAAKSFGGGAKKAVYIYFAEGMVGLPPLIPYYPSFDYGYIYDSQIIVQDSDCGVTYNDASEGAFYAYIDDNSFGVGVPMELAEYEAEYSKFVKKYYLDLGNTPELAEETREFLAEFIQKMADDGVNIYNSDKLALVEDIARYMRNEDGTHSIIPRYNAKFDEDPIGKNLNRESNMAVAFLRDYVSTGGVCRHFASAGTLIYRALGIPARYCTGAAANYDSSDPEGFIAVKAGDMHAWVEVYIDGIGWVYQEVTSVSTGSSDDDDDEGKPVDIVLAPESSQKKYSSQNSILYYSGNIVGAANGDGKNVWKSYQSKGYSVEYIGDRYSFVQSGPGKRAVEISIDDIVIYDPDGYDVTEKFNITLKSGTLHLYSYELTVTTGNYEKEYDGQAFSVDELLGGIAYSGNIPSDFTISAVPSGATHKKAGKITNRCSLVIRDADGNDVTDEFKITAKYGSITITTREITLTGASKTASITSLGGGALTCGDNPTVTVGSLVSGHYITSPKYIEPDDEEGKTVCALSNIGKKDNNLTSVIIKDAAGKDVTANYYIIYEPGTLTVTP